MKKLFLTLLLCLFPLSAWADTIDSYDESNFTASFLYVGADYSTIGGQALTTTSAYTVTSLKFYLKKVGAPTGNAVATLYNSQGTVGTNAYPTGAALDTSDNYDVSGLSDAAFALITFTFSTPIVVPAQDLCIALEYSGGNAANYVGLARDNTSPTHGGNLFYYDPPTWAAVSTQDTIFYLYGTPVAVAAGQVIMITEN